MIWVTMSDMKRAFLQWHRETNAIDEARRVKLSVSFLAGLQQVVAANLQPVLSFKDSQKKERVLLRIIEATHLGLKDAFNHWRNKTETAHLHDQLTEEKKRDLVLLLSRFMTHNQHELLRVLLGRFHHNARTSGIQSRFFTRLMSTSAGSFIDSFARWKALPERRDNEQFQRASRFERNLRLLVQNTLKLYAQSFC